MSKKSGVSPKSVESGVLVQAELQEKLWSAVPMHPGENLKAWFPRVASKLGWTARRVRAFWNGEARRIDYAEIVTLNRRIEALKAAEQRHQELAHEIRRSLALGSERIALDGEPDQQHDDAPSAAGRMVPRSVD